MTEDQTIGEITLGEAKKLIFTLREWNGRQYACVRKFVSTEKYEGWTKAGLSMSLMLLQEITAKLDSLERSIPQKEKHEFSSAPKGKTSDIKISTLPPEDHGLPWVDVREFVTNQRYQGPTKRGIRFRWDLLPEVLACLHRQEKVLCKRESKQLTLFGPGALWQIAEGEPTQEMNPPVKDSIASLMNERIKAFPSDFLDGAVSKGKTFKLPDEPLTLNESNTGEFSLATERGPFCTVRNPVEANFVIYAQMRRHFEITVPEAMIQVFKAVKSYENYVRTIQARLIAAIMKTSHQRSIAEYEARKRMTEEGLPYLSLA